MRNRKSIVAGDEGITIDRRRDASGGSSETDEARMVTCPVCSGRTPEGPVCDLCGASLS